MSTIEKALDKLGRALPGEGAASPEARADGQPRQQPRDKAASAGQAPQRPHNIKLDLRQLEAAGLIIKENDKSALSEEYRAIKRPLLLNAFSTGAAAVPNGNLIMITSALPGEGKTFTAINLAMSIALEKDKTVLLVDADISRPVISRYLSEEPPRGLVDYLINDSLPLSDVLVRTEIPKLRILPAGQRTAQSTELLASDNMRRLTEELAVRYPDRVVIFDSPPLLATSEAAVLAGLIGQVVMVVEAEKTPQDVIREALAQLDSKAMISLVLNKSRRHRRSHYYDYYGYYADNRQ